MCTVTNLEQDEELKDSPEGRREEASVGDSHLEEKCVEEAVPHVDQGVLVHVGVPDTVGPCIIVVVDGDVVVGGGCLVVGHDDLWCHTHTHSLTHGSRTLGRHGCRLDWRRWTLNTVEQNQPQSQNDDIIASTLKLPIQCGDGYSATQEIVEVSSC